MDSLKLHSDEIEALAVRLCEQHSLRARDYASLIAGRTPTIAERLAEAAVGECERVYGDVVYTRGLIEFTNYCKNDCLYCGIRKGNSSCNRYRLSTEQILACVDEGYDLGFRTFVLQGGEDPAKTDDWLCNVVAAIKRNHSDCAVTLSVGERSRESYARLREAGADRYLLRHETASREHYRKLHPSSMSYENRMRCISDLRELGFVVGVGFMVGSPFQTPDDLAADLKFIEDFKPDMCGIGPFVPHHATPFARFDGGTVELTCFMLSLIRLIQPNILLPATTALGTIDENGREKGMMAGANVVMPNLSPTEVRSDYELYDNKICTGEEAAECMICLKKRVNNIGYEIVTDRGDNVKYKREH
ncbi:MAG: [FeFe] hydrogenase H-cluster radical SAM maturase HydE [Eggerthellaceae bacterium]|nr:[FeFe] hydrogenase H-cluster radical SAM maturase HydE [Eggerthellaceae bacterium]